MSDPKATTYAERSAYWIEVFSEAWELSREQFQRHHELLVAVIAFAVIWYRQGIEKVVDDLLTSFFSVVLPVGLYLTGLGVFNFLRAMIRVPVHRQREIERLQVTHQQSEEALQQEAARLTGELNELKERRTNPVSALVHEEHKSMNFLLRALVSHIDGPVETSVNSTTEVSRPLAQKLVARFKSAGWKTTLSHSSAGHSGHNGIAVTGSNEDLVMGVIAILRSAQFPGVSGMVQPSGSQDPHSIRIEVSYRR